MVDDNSPDGTGQLADDIAAKNPAVSVLHRKEKDGLGRAYCAGFAWALKRDYEFIFRNGRDFSHNPDDIPVFLKAAQDADLVIGSRYCNGIRVINWPLNRLILSMCVACMSGSSPPCPSATRRGFKCFRRRALASLNLDAVRSMATAFRWN